MAQLPYYIDEHSQRVDAPADVVWTALLKVLRREMGSSGPIARILGCDPARGTAEFAGRPGEAVPGFRVVEVEPGRRLALRGHHRFSNYALTFVLDGDRLRAQTHAAFPGVLGWLYRSVVIGSGGHRIVTRRLLGRVARGDDAPIGHGGVECGRVAEQGVQRLGVRPEGRDRPSWLAGLDVDMAGR
jgi:hypothetical protein